MVALPSPGLRLVSGPGPVGRPALPGALFSEYRLDAAYDEMFERAGHTRAPYDALLEELAPVSTEELRRRQAEADRAFLHQGITFTVYGDEAGTERIFPFDLLPRLVTAREWERLERGLTQRLTAINLFLEDIYHEGRILAEGVVPRDLVYSCRHYRREMRGMRVHRGIYVSVAGTDLVRLEDGAFVVLEDNLRVPSGVSYMLANREVTKRVFPRLFNRYNVRPIAHYGQALLATLRALAPAGRPDPTIVVLTPGVGGPGSDEQSHRRAAPHPRGDRPGLRRRPAEARRLQGRQRRAERAGRGRARRAGDLAVGRCAAVHAVDVPGCRCAPAGPRDRAAGAAAVVPASAA